MKRLSFFRISLAIVIGLLLSQRIGSVAVGQTPKTDDAAKPAGKEVNVWLLGGQSNMQGLGVVAQIPKSAPRIIPFVQFWNGKAFVPIELGVTNTSEKATSFGPEIGFGAGIASKDRPAFLIKYFASGMPLHHGFNGGKWAGGDPAPKRRNFYPGKDADDLNAGTLYREMRARFQAGMKNLEDQGLRPVVRGFVWMQGEQDSKQQESATTYASNLRQLRDRLVADMNAEGDLPMVFGQVLPHEPALPRFEFRKEIREQMLAADQASKRPEAIPGATMVSTDGFPTLNDTVHYNTEGQLRLGGAMAEAMKPLVKQAAKAKKSTEK